MMEQDILKELKTILDENTVAFFSVVLTRKKDKDIIPTIIAFGIDKATYETRLEISDAIINLAQKMRERE
jgi:hypothetical protein